MVAVCETSPFETTEDSSAVSDGIISVSRAGPSCRPRAGRSLACHTLAAMLSLSPLSRVFGARMSKKHGVTSCHGFVPLSLPSLVRHACLPSRCIRHGRPLAACRARYLREDTKRRESSWRALPRRVEATGVCVKVSSHMREYTSRYFSFIREKSCRRNSHRNWRKVA